MATYTGTSAGDEILVEIFYENPGVLDHEVYGYGGDDNINLDYEYRRLPEGALSGGVYSGRVDLYGGSGNDHISHPRLNNYLHIGYRAPDIEGVTNYYYGEDGDDTLEAASIESKYRVDGAGHDFLDGGPGNDTYLIYEPTDNVSEDAGGGYDTVTALQSGSFGDGPVILRDNFEKLVLGDPTDVSIISGGARAGSGNSLDNMILGNCWDNQLNGAAGNDTIYGASVLGGGDSLGGMFHFTFTDSDRISGGSGNDVIYGGRSNDDRGDGADEIFGDDGNDTVWAGGGDDTVYGGVGNDSLYGQSGNDNLYGADGADLLGGGSGNDLLEGGRGDDKITGREGLDSPSGGGGNDKFDYDDVAYSSPGAAYRDVIYDFGGAGCSTRTDHIDLSTIDANTGVSGNQTCSFIGGSPFTAAGQVRVEASGCDTLIQANVTGTSGAEMEILAEGVLSTQWNDLDFIL